MKWMKFFDILQSYIFFTTLYLFFVKFNLYSCIQKHDRMQKRGRNKNIFCVILSVKEQNMENKRNFLFSSDFVLRSFICFWCLLFSDWKKNTVKIYLFFFKYIHTHAHRLVKRLKYLKEILKMNGKIKIKGNSWFLTSFILFTLSKINSI